MKTRGCIRMLAFCGNTSVVSKIITKQCECWFKPIVAWNMRCSFHRGRHPDAFPLHAGSSNCWPVGERDFQRRSSILVSGAKGNPIGLAKACGAPASRRSSSASNAHVKSGLRAGAETWRSQTGFKKSHSRVAWFMQFIRRCDYYCLAPIVGNSNGLRGFCPLLVSGHTYAAPGWDKPQAKAPKGASCG